MKRDSGKMDKQSASGDRPVNPASTAPSAQAAFASYAAPLVGHAVEYASAVREDASPEALHKLRVSLRRLRSLWWAFAPLLEKDESIRQRALFKYLATAAGKTRDWDILIELLSLEDSGAHDITPRLQEARGSALAVSRETLSNADVKHLLREALAGASKELNTAHERMPLRKFAARRVDAAKRSLKKRMKRANRARRSDYTAFHDVRKAGKKLRYLLDFFEPVLKGSCKSTARRVKRIQKRFGALNDVVASEGLLREHAASLAGSGDAGATLDWLGKERKRRMRTAAALLRKR
ncbi:CHAD domain-containing protein [Paraburkholderia sp. RAU2J]|uniref:CHAD domain-containing protein n=1 Tax=Paraburkholderia sp. RAU2J TaxID=1938810 RepID=UPI000EABEDBF|nr:CHAD domain-containing protein [Paraburkholderia sp. RAU2J]RKT22646.1 CHAD domain-containing protein [Paraburkholderia sp. RAU2J]